MQPKQQELWCAEPHPRPSIYHQLPPEEQARLIRRLARLISRIVQPKTTHPPQSKKSIEP